MIAATTRATNQCLYCVVAHGAILRIDKKKPLVADQVPVNHRKADIMPRQRARLYRRRRLEHCGHHRVLWPLKPDGQLFQFDAKP